MDRPSRRHVRSTWIVGWVLAGLGALLLTDAGALLPASSPRALQESPPAELDPAAWGGDHVGKTLPSYTTGEECLFCHRADVGPTWGKNRHQLTVRAPTADSPAMRGLRSVPGLAAIADEVAVLLGGSRRVRFLKRSAAYGHFTLLSTGWIPLPGTGAGELGDLEDPEWDETKFGDSCAGCHATAVHDESRAFSSPSLDCFTCHGLAMADHGKDKSLMIFSKERRDTAREEISICGQCHIRNGTSRSTGRPYPNQFVAGDNLFRDFVVPFSSQELERLGPADRHILENVRDVVLYGNESVTCLTCHAVHQGSSSSHVGLRARPSCYTCHEGEEEMSVVKPYEVHSKVCEY